MHEDRPHASVHDVVLAAVADTVLTGLTNKRKREKESQG